MGWGRMTGLTLLAALCLAACGTGTYRASSTADREAYVLARAAYADLLQAMRKDTITCTRSGDTVRYIGTTDERFLDCVGRNPDASTLRLTTNGGPNRPAILAARLIADYGMDVEALGRCDSACGNYVAPAARSFRVLPYSVVMLHGGPHGDRLRLRQELTRLLLSEGADPQELTDALLEREVDRLVEGWEMHEQFRRDFNVGPGWYHLDFYVERMNEVPDYEQAALIVSEDFTRKCLPDLDIPSFWMPQTGAEERATRSLYALDDGKTIRNVFSEAIWIMGTDIANPPDCR